MGTFAQAYGYLYNWFSATAATGLGTTASGEATASICPAGWRLPRGGNIGGLTNDFDILNAIMAGYGSSGGNQNSTYQSAPWDYYANWHPTGVWTGAFAGSRDNSPNFNTTIYNWSSTVNTSDNAYALYVGPTNMNPGGSSSNKRFGYAVRCVI